MQIGQFLTELFEKYNG